MEFFLEVPPGDCSRALLFMRVSVQIGSHDEDKDENFT